MMQLLSSLWVTARHRLVCAARPGRRHGGPTGDARRGAAPSAALIPDRGLSAFARSRPCGIVDRSRRAASSRSRRSAGCSPLNAPNSMRTSAELLTEYNGEIWSKLDGALAGRHRVRGAEGCSNCSTGCTPTRRERALPAHDGRGAFAGRLAGDRRGLRLRPVQAHRRRRWRPRHAAVGDPRGASERARHAVRSAGGHRGGAARRGRAVARRILHRLAMCSSSCLKAPTPICSGISFTTTTTPTA